MLCLGVGGLGVWDPWCTVWLSFTARDKGTRATERDEAGAEEPVAADEDELLVQNKTAERTAEAERDTETQMIDETTERQDSIAESSDKTTQETKKGPHQINLWPVWDPNICSS